jgi:hypothetical protein
MNEQASLQVRDASDIGVFNVDLPPEAIRAFLSNEPMQEMIVPDNIENFMQQMGISEPEYVAESDVAYKYAEGKIISDFKSYIDKTYYQHYKTEQESIECFDAWIALGDATPTFRNTAIKYLWRYGKKNGSNKADLMKALHYTLMCLYNDHYKDGT